MQLYPRGNFANSHRQLLIFLMQLLKSIKLAGRGILLHVHMHPPNRNYQLCSFISLNNFTFIIYVKFHEKIMILFRYLIRSTKIETNKIIFIILPENLLLESLAKLYQHVQYDLKRKCFVLHFSFNKPQIIMFFLNPTSFKLFKAKMFD